MLWGYTCGPHTLKGKRGDWEEGVCEDKGPKMGIVIREIENI